MEIESTSRFSPLAAQIVVENGASLQLVLEPISRVDSKKRLFGVHYDVLLLHRAACAARTAVSPQATRQLAHHRLRRDILLI